jgi:hypothetical protein
MAETKQEQKPWEAMVALADRDGVSRPSDDALADLERRYPDLRESPRWQQVADMTRQGIERYLEDVGLPLDLAPVVASMAARDGEPWELVKVKLIASDRIVSRSRRAR